MYDESRPAAAGGPLTPAGRLARLRLIRSRRVGPQTFHRLMAEHGSAEAALDALPDIAAAAGVRGYAVCTHDAAEAEIEAGFRAGARLICHGEPGYPVPLMDLVDAPPVLWALGHPRTAAQPMVAMVGARNASSLGIRMARRLAEGLGQAGHTVVSGLARGIDTAAHQAALPTGTIAVMPGGVDRIYPEENAKLAGDIARDGLRLSEHPPGTVPQARHFPLRNRLISGLAQAVIVVEAAAKSGSLITARAALDQGREVMAVPGHPFDARASGCNMLIRDGAALVRGPDDVAEALSAARSPAQADLFAEDAAPPQPARSLHEAPAAPPCAPAAPPTAVPMPADLQARILTLLGAAPVAEDQLIRDLALPTAMVTGAVLALELDGSVARQPGGLLARAQG
jgi:DNA processing protein